MIKRTEASKLKTPSVNKGKQDYTGKGKVDLCDYKTVSVSKAPKPEEWALLNLAESFQAFIKCRFFG
jgi:hypothetical protein